MSDTKLMDIEPGGESTQYESIKMYTNPPAKQTGQMGAGSPHTRSEMRSLTPDTAAIKARDDDDEMARRVGIGGSASGALGTGNKGLSSKNQDSDDNDVAAAKIRRLQGYGPGSGVGG